MPSRPSLGFRSSVIAASFFVIYLLTTAASPTSLSFPFLLFFQQALVQSSKGIQCLRKGVVHIAQLELIPYPLLCGKNIAEFHGSTRRCVLDDVHTAPVTTCLVLIYSVSSIMEYLAYNDRSNRDFRGGQNCQSSQSCHCPHCVSYDRPPRTCSFCCSACIELIGKQAGWLWSTVKMGYSRRGRFIV